MKWFAAFLRLAAPLSFGSLAVAKGSKAQTSVAKGGGAGGNAQNAARDHRTMSGPQIRDHRTNVRR